MKKIILTFYCVLFLFNNLKAQQYVWQQLASFNGIARFAAFGFSIGNYGYIGGGYNQSGYNGANLSDFWQYDPSTNSWTQKNDAPISVRAASTFVINGKGYLTGGILDVAPLNAMLYVYDPLANSWTVKASFPGRPRYGAGAFSIGTKGYFGVGNGAFASGPYYTDFYEYDAVADIWTQKATYPGSPGYGTFGISVNGEGYYGFGGNDEMTFGDWYQYDPISDSWAQKASFPGSPRSYIGGFSINNVIYVGTGNSDDVNVTKDCYKYNPDSDSWSQIEDYGGGARWAVASFNIGNVGYFGTGADSAGNYHNEFWEYTPSSPPVASFESNDSNICTNTCINFTDHSIDATSWLWVFAGATPVVSTNQNPQQICYANAGTYDVTLIAGNSRGSDTLTYHDYITVDSPPIPVITESHDTLYCKTDPTYSFYQWYYSTILIPGATDTSLFAYYNGNYNIKVTNKNGCSISKGINIILGVQTYNYDNNISIYPNPAATQLTIHMSSLYNNESIAVFITSVLGQKASTFTSFLDSRGFATIDVSPLSSGIYFLHLESESSSAVKMFVKE